jgi:hypothetical protein
VQTGQILWFPLSGRRTHSICRGGVNRQNCSKRPIIRRSGSPGTPRGFHARPRAVLHPRSPEAPRRNFPQHDLPPPADRAAGPRPYWKPTIHLRWSNRGSDSPIDNHSESMAGGNASEAADSPVWSQRAPRRCKQLQSVPPIFERATRFCAPVRDTR